VNRRAALGLALVVCAPTLYEALWTQTIPVEEAVIRFLIALLASAILVGAVATAMSRRNR
jgi:hypothetical protein